jgi:hypothetical protein
MLSKRYTVVLADRTTGVVRRLTVSLRPVVVGLVTIVTLPIPGSMVTLIGSGVSNVGMRDSSILFQTAVV